eukprot:5113283-Prymnesium_polylepis.2
MHADRGTQVQVAPRDPRRPPPRCWSLNDTSCVVAGSARSQPAASRPTAERASEPSRAQVRHNQPAELEVQVAGSRRDAAAKLARGGPS